MVVGDDERTKIKRVLVASFMYSDEEMEDTNTRRKRFVTRPISWESSKFRNLKKQIDFKGHFCPRQINPYNSSSIHS